MSDIILEAKNIFKSFKKPVLFEVLKDISFTINRGEFVSIVGKSGCGKSTLLYILSTLDTDYQGELFLDQANLTALPKKKLSTIRNEQIGFVFQFHYLLSEFTVLENVMLPARKLGRKTNMEIEKDAMTKLGLLGIEDQAHKKASLISGGQKQRVSIARALINDPKIIMGDEPTGNLDTFNAENVFNIFRELSHTQKLSLLVVTHDIDFANKTDRIMEMEDGRFL